MRPDGFSVSSGARQLASLRPLFAHYPVITPPLLAHNFLDIRPVSVNMFAICGRVCQRSVNWFLLAGGGRGASALVRELTVL